MPQYLTKRMVDQYFEELKHEIAMRSSLGRSKFLADLRSRSGAIYLEMKRRWPDMHQAISRPAVIVAKDKPGVRRIATTSKGTRCIKLALGGKCSCSSME